MILHPSTCDLDLKQLAALPAFNGCNWQTAGFAKSSVRVAVRDMPGPFLPFNARLIARMQPMNGDIEQQSGQTPQIMFVMIALGSATRNL